MINKASLIAGIKNTTEIELPQYENQKIAIREISDSEYQKFVSDYNDMGTITIKDDKSHIRTNTKKISNAKYNAKVTLVTLALNNDKNKDDYSSKEVERFKSGVVDYLADEILKFCDLKTTKKMEEEAQIEAAKMKALEEKAKKGELKKSSDKDLSDDSDEFRDDES